MFDLHTLTQLHTAISIVAIFTGIPVLTALAAGRPRPTLATITIVLLVVTSVSGFLFPYTQFLPSHAVGILSLGVLVVTIWSRWGGRRLTNTGRAYAVTLTVAVYLDAFVFVVQAFLKVPALHAAAPTQQSPIFAIAQAILLAAFVVLGYAVLRGQRRGHPASQSAAVM